MLLAADDRVGQPSVAGPVFIFLTCPDGETMHPEQAEMWVSPTPGKKHLTLYAGFRKFFSGEAGRLILRKNLSLSGFYIQPPDPRPLGKQMDD